MESMSTPQRTATRVSTSATSTRTPIEDREGEDVDLSRHRSGECDSINEPKKLDDDLEPSKSHFQQLQSRIAKLEHAAERERHEKVATERQMTMAHIAPPLPQHLPDFRTCLDVLGDEKAAHAFARREAPRHGPPGSLQLLRTMVTLEMQLEVVRKEHDAVCKTWSDRDRLRGMEQEWERARQGLMPLGQRKSHKAEAATIQHPDAGMVSAGGEANATRPRFNEKPQLNEVNWQTFIRPLHSDSRLPIFAIDILKGDPMVTWEAPTSTHFCIPSNNRIESHATGADEKAKQRNAAASSKQPDLKGQAVIPERIRINSAHICRILGSIAGREIDAPAVMIRPYKALAYYDDAIRRKFAELEARFGKAKADTAEATNLEDHRGSPEAERSNVDGELENDGEMDELTYSPAAYEHLGCLLTLMDGRLKAKIDYLFDNGCQSVSFSDIWYLFKPGDEVIEQSRHQVYRIISISSAPHKVFSPYQRSWDKNARAKEETPVILKCVYIDFDGKELGPIIRTIRIAKFEGEKAVTALEVYPLRFAEEKKAVIEDRSLTATKNPGELTLRDKMISRGRMFLHVTDFKHMHYSGLTIDTRDEVDSHVVVDFEEAFSHAAKTFNHPRNRVPGQDDAETWRPELKFLIGESLDEGFDDEEACTSACCYPMATMIYKDADTEKKRNADYMTFLKTENGQRDPSPAIYPRPLAEVKGQKNPLSNEELLIMSYRVFGFILRTRKWAQLSLDHLTLPSFKQESVKKGADAVSTQEGNTTESDGTSTNHNLLETEHGAEDNKTAFEQLVLPRGHKEMVTSLVTQHFRDKASGGNADIVRGKGKGLIILLHGAPGVGKTTTAEGVAEMFEKPLFQMTCGDLGTSAPEVEKALESHFSLANRWGCVLLLDEADVFLAARQKEDFVRNGLVSVFLRVLEYYAGILFLTTNRVGDFDEAFASRIHISLYYPHLTLENTEAIFNLNFDTIEERFTASGRKIQIEKESILARARAHFEAHPKERWNGRQIRNACQTALALAEFRAQGGSHLCVADPKAVVELKVDDLQVVSDAYLQFMNYLNDVRGKDVDLWAKAMKLRLGREFDLMLYAEAKNKDPATLASEGKQRETAHPDRARAATATSPSVAGPALTTPPHISHYPPPPPPPAAHVPGAAAPPPGYPPAGQHQPPYAQGQGFAPQPAYPYQSSYGYAGYPPPPPQPMGPPQPAEKASAYPSSPPPPPPAPQAQATQPPPYATPEYAAWYHQQVHR
ncbi:hypothetical protein RB597_005172 [Gaeumannomyces tritici]